MNDRAAYANANAALLPLADKSVHMIATSPPYWGLRDYGTAKWEGGDPECDHAPDKRGSRFATPVSSKQASNAGSGTASERDCRCGAKRIDNQLGLERIHDCLAWARGEEPCGACYVCHLREWAAEMWRVLRDDGCMFLNLGDSYASSGKAGPVSDKTTWHGGHGGGDYDAIPLGRAPTAPGLKSKDLVGIPWRVALALQSDGWYLRQDIIWAKGNSMPESVKDRCSKSHEYVLLLTKNEKYYFDSYAIRERSTSQAVPPLRARSTPNGVLQEQSASGWTNGEMPGLYNGTQKGLGQEIQRQREGTPNGQALLLFREGAEGETGIPSSLSANTGTTRTLQGNGAGENVRPETQGANQEILAEREGQSPESDKGQAVRQNGGGTLLQAQDGNQAQASNSNVSMHTD